MALIYRSVYVKFSGVFTFFSNVFTHFHFLKTRENAPIFRVFTRMVKMKTTTGPLQVNDLGRLFRIYFHCIYSLIREYEKEKTQMAKLPTAFYNRRWQAQGLCPAPGCHKPWEGPQLFCDRCRDAQAKKMHHRSIVRALAGICVVCRDPIDDGQTRCPRCREAHAARQVAFKKRKSRA